VPIDGGLEALDRPPSQRGVCASGYIGGYIVEQSRQVLMARAMALFEQQSDTSWMPGTILLATPKRLRGKCLPGSPERDARLAIAIRDQRKPQRIGDVTGHNGSVLPPQTPRPHRGNVEP
jgi:hypothetical protein